MPYNGLSVMHHRSPAGLLSWITFDFSVSTTNEAGDFCAVRFAGLDVAVVVSATVYEYVYVAATGAVAGAEVET